MKIRKQLFMLAIVISVSNLGCRKNDTATLTVVVMDYITGLPIQGAVVKRSFSTGFDLSCLCYRVNGADSLGITDANGQLGGLLTLEHIFVNKDGYFSAQEFYYSIHEKTEYLLKFYMFKKGGLRLTTNPVRSYYPDPYVEVGPVLKNGSMKSLTNNGDRLPGITGFIMYRPAAGDMKNRILVLKRNDATSRIDTLYRNEVFVPANTEVPVTVNY